MAQRFPFGAGGSLEQHIPDAALRAAVEAKGPLAADPTWAGNVRYFIHSKIGEGPSPQPAASALLDPACGLPK
jgi:hypothetical protein